MSEEVLYISSSVNKLYNILIISEEYEGVRTLRCRFVPSSQHGIGYGTSEASALPCCSGLGSCSLETLASPEGTVGCDRFPLP